MSGRSVDGPGFHYVLGEGFGVALQARLAETPEKRSPFGYNERETVGRGSDAHPHVGHSRVQARRDYILAQDVSHKGLLRLLALDRQAAR